MTIRKMTIMLAGLLLFALPAAPLVAEEAAPAAQKPAAEVEVSFGELQVAHVLPVETRMWLDAPVDEVWQKAILDIDGWWPHSYRTDSRIVFEPWVGGRVYEQFPGGDTGALFGNVLYIEEGLMVKLDGQWGMPRANVSGGIWKFEELDGGTLVTTSGAAIGEISAGMSEAREAGTREIWLALKRFVEDGERVDRTQRGE